jgi:hypothetical protein
MQEIRLISFCDYPGCRDASAAARPDGQLTTSVEILVHVVGKGGRKPGPAVVDLCDEHRDLLIEQFKAFKKHDQSRYTGPVSDSGARA